MAEQRESHGSEDKVASFKRNIVEAARQFKSEYSHLFTRNSSLPFVGRHRSRSEKERLLTFQLNIMTPENFERCCLRLRPLTFDTENDLRGLVDAVVTAALWSPLYSEVYATLCKLLRHLPPVPLAQRLPWPHPASLEVTFGMLLMLRLQTEFHKDKRKDLMEDSTKAPAASAEAKKARLQAALKAAEEGCREHLLSLLTFLGRLSAVREVNEVVLVDCLLRLVEKRSVGHNLEAICRLMDLVGPRVEASIASNRDLLDAVFYVLEKAAGEESTSDRVSSLLSDLCQRRKNGWPSKVTTDQPTTLDNLRQQGRQTEATSDGQQLQEYSPLALILANERDGATGKPEDVYRLLLADGEAMLTEGLGAVCVLAYCLLYPAPNNTVRRVLQTVSGGEPLQTIADQDVVTASYQLVDHAFSPAQRRADEKCGEFDASLYQYRCPLLRLFLAADRRRQACVLQGAVLWTHTHHHPPGVLRQVFDALFAEGVVEEGHFWAWVRDSNPDPIGQADKEMAVMSTAPFFVWLREAGRR